MASNRYRIEPLAQHHDRADFSCGVDALDRYLRQQASQDVRRRVAAVFVLHDVTAGTVAGYYTLSVASIEPASLPPELTAKLPRYARLPAVLLGRLAIDGRYRGQHLGRFLLFDALRRALVQSEQVATPAVIVDAKDDAARRFYERHGLRRFADDQWRLFIPLADVAQTRSTPE